MVVLHGMLGSSRNWLSAGVQLTSHWHVHALDMRNHGQSPHADSMSYDEMAADVLAWMDEHDLPTADFIGHSMGGKIAMVLACRHPERVRRLVVVDIAPKDYLSRGHRAEFAAMHELELREIHTRADAELRFESRVDDWAMRKFLTTNLERAKGGKGWRWIINLPVITAALTELERNPVKDHEKFEGEALFIAGGKSHYIEVGDWATIERHFPGARAEVLPDSGHNPHMQSREAFVALIEDTFS